MTTKTIDSKKNGEKMKIAINPPPQDGCCESCGRNVKDLKPFGKAGDPLVGDFNGALLVKTFRSMAMPLKDKVWDEISKKYEKKGNYDGFEDELIKKVGKKRAGKLFFADQVANTVSASWECRDCIVLNDEEYFKPVEEKRRKNENTR